MSVVFDAEIRQTYVILKFDKTPRAVTLDHGDFTLFHSDGGSQAAPGEVVSNTTSGFKPINIEQDYESITKRLKLYFAQSLDKGDYFIRVSSFTDASGTELIDEEDPEFYPFIYNFTTFDPAASDPEASRPPVEIKDYSIKTHTIVSTDSVGETDEFKVTAFDPTKGAYFIEEDHKNGTASITFSSRPGLQFINANYIKVQRKKLASVGRWEKVNANFSLDSSNPKVYVYFPSIPDGSYNTPDLKYFEDNYKYRIVLSSEIAGTSD